MKYLASYVSLSRIIVSMVFYWLIVTISSPSIVILFVCFFLIECSDLCDGMIARSTKTVSNLGKLLDPLCDVTAHFLCIYSLQQVNLAPAIVLVVFVLREFWIQMLRMQLLKYNIVLAAKFAGKIKTWLFGIAILGSLLIYPKSVFYEYALVFRQLVFGVYYVAAVTSIISGLQYVWGAYHAIKSIQRNFKNKQNN